MWQSIRRQTSFLALKRYFLWFFSLKSVSRQKMKLNQKKNGLKIFVFNGFQFFRFFEKINFSLKNWNPLKTKIFRPFFFWFHCIFGLDSDFNEKNHKKYRFSAKNVSEICDFSRFSNFKIARTFLFFKIERPIEARSNQHIKCHILKLVTFF